MAHAAIRLVTSPTPTGVFEARPSPRRREHISGVCARPGFALDVTGLLPFSGTSERFSDSTLSFVEAVTISKGSDRAPKISPSWGSLARSAFPGARGMTPTEREGYREVKRRLFRKS